jgi:ketoreductase RED2
MSAGMSEFAGKVALVTGSSSGIGEAIARRLSALGASVVINSARSVEAGQRIAAELGDQGALRAGRHRRGRRAAAPARCHAGALRPARHPGQQRRLDHGGAARRPRRALSDEIFAKTFEVNVTGTWRLSKAAMPHLMQSEDGNVLTITSIAGVRPVGSSIAYSMAKAALNQMTRLLAKSCGPVRVNAVAPGLVETPGPRTGPRSTRRSRRARR